MLFLKLKQSEKFFHSKLMFYIPWRNEDDLKLNFSTFEESYQVLEDNVKQNMQQFEYNSDSVEAALQDYEENGPVVDVWDTLNSEAIQRNEDDFSCPRNIDQYAALINP